LARDGRPLGALSLGVIVKKTGQEAGVKVTCHTLRRTMATEMLRGGAQIVEVATLLGHAHLAATQRYTKVAGVDLRRMQDEKHPRGKR
jgi:integrase/recombinase XerD